MTLISQDLSEFTLHVRAILGLSIAVTSQLCPAASAVNLPHGDSNGPLFENLDTALMETDTMLRLSGKPQIRGHRRMGVTLARADSINSARDKARRAAAAVKVHMK